MKMLPPSLHVDAAVREEHFEHPWKDEGKRQRNSSIQN
jgi:hypothetical protein